MVPWKFIGFVLVLVAFVFFVGFNLENEATFRYFFVEKAVVTTNVVYIMFFSFIFGVLVTLPLVFKKKVQYFEKPDDKEALRNEKKALKNERKAAREAKRAARLEKKLERAQEKNKKKGIFEQD